MLVERSEDYEVPAEEVFDLFDEFVEYEQGELGHFEEDDNSGNLINIRDLRAIDSSREGSTRYEVRLEELEDGSERITAYAEYGEVDDPEELPQVKGPRDFEIFENSMEIRIGGNISDDWVTLEQELEER